MALTKVPSNLDAAVSVTQSQSDNSTNVATTAYVDLRLFQTYLIPLRQH